MITCHFDSWNRQIFVDSYGKCSDVPVSRAEWAGAASFPVSHELSLCVTEDVNQKPGKVKILFYLSQSTQYHSRPINYIINRNFFLILYIINFC